MRLEVFISDLLFEHDCVVVPGFGGLVANYRPARINHRSHLIHPPSKHIGFNKNLQENDGLLVLHVSKITGLPYKEAQAKVEECVAEFQHLLLHEGRVSWEKIGVFFKDKTGQIQFIPEEQENYLLSSYGLQAIQLHPVQREALAEENETPIVSISPRRNYRKVWSAAAAIAIPLLVGGGLLVRNQIKHNEFSFASLNPFAGAEVQCSFMPREEFTQSNIYSFDGRELPSIPAPEELKEVKKEANAAASPDHTRVENTKKWTGSTSRKNFAVIGGAFKIKENAQNFLDKLKSEGFDASFAGTRDGMTLVAYGTYDSRAEAEQALQNIRSANQGPAWIRSY